MWYVFFLSFAQKANLLNGLYRHQASFWFRTHPERRCKGEEEFRTSFHSECEGATEETRCGHRRQIRHPRRIMPFLYYQPLIL